MIFITGCAKSGTTLLRRMFYAFSNTKIIDNEISLYDFIKSKNNYNKILVGKRDTQTLLSYKISLQTIMNQIDIIKKHKIYIINIVRDGRDVILDPWVPPDRWISCILQSKVLNDIISMTVFFEDLIRRPDAIQNVIASTFNLIPSYKFSEYPAFFPTDEDVNRYVKYDLSTSKIKQNINSYKDIIKNERELNQFEGCLKLYNYL